MPIRILTAGNIASDPYESLRQIKDSGLSGQEIEFVRHVYMKNDIAKRIGEYAKELGLILSVHASYYINLSSAEEKKVSASKERILLACERGHHLGAKNIVFHPGYYTKRDKEEVYQLIKTQILDLMGKTREHNWDVVLCPETAGKKACFGTLIEILRLQKEIRCGITIDFCHLLARDGKIDYKKTVSMLPTSFHAHFSGVEFTEKGEKRHIPIDEKAFKRLAQELKIQKKDCTIVCEAPDPFEDAKKMKGIVDRFY
ncbi:MAG: TIM barrel protein [Nanoarchaeota archaeon]|nr:TIM barrel protein [Nanoarchaeota archaeon]